jgi:plastocyanin
MLDPDNDGIYEGSFTMPASADAGLDLDAPEAAQIAATLVITSDNVVMTYDGTLQTVSEGIVSDSTNGQAVAGATVTVFEVTDASEDTGAGAILWDAEAWGQVNPQTTGADGGFGLWVPVGTYQFEVTKDGYQSYRSGPIAITDKWLKADVQLTPIVQKKADYVVEISQNGFSPSALWIRPGSVVRVVNFDAGAHSTASEPLGLAQSGTAGSSSWTSGLLSPNESFTVQLDDEGTFSYFDKANPFNTADIVVDANAPLTVKVYLPLVMKNQ